MMRFHSLLLVSLSVALLMLTAAGCHNTWQGVKADTRHDLEKTGQKLDKAADKIEGHDKKDGG
jgi:predicted small secreted protein